MKFKVCFLALVIIVLSSTSVYAVNKIPIYRAYDPVSKEHLFTPDQNEVNTLARKGWKNEGIAWYAYDQEVAGPSNGFIKTGMSGVRRLFNPAAGEHMYTRDQNEIQVLTKRGWSLDFNGAPIFHDADSFWAGYSVDRLYNRQANRHHLTIDYSESKILQSQGWKYEGTAFNVFNK